MGERILIATRKGLFSASRSNGSWDISNAEFVGENCSQILIDERDGTRYVALDHGHFGNKLHRARKGQDWEEISVPVYPEKPANEEPWKDMHGREVPQSLLLIWSLEAGLESRPGELWCGTVPGGLFRSSDSGDSWELVESLWNHPLRRKWFGGGMDYPGIHSICMHPTDADRIDIAVSCGGVWTSKDAGAVWENVGQGWRAEFMPPDLAADPAIQDVHCLVNAPSEPNTFWAQHHNGIFVSKDACANWSEIKNVKPSVFGFATAVHPKDSNTAWFIPAQKDEHRAPSNGQLVVTRTKDGGESFETLSSGLPQHHAYDIVYRHALDIDSSGNCLAFGSTTGGLWITENGGDKWMEISSHLPPVYAVRFD